MIQLEKENFKVNSEGWQQLTNEQGITYLESPTKDIWEYVSGVDKKLIGQQLFTWDAAMRETKKDGKRMPSDGEWNTLIDNDGGLKEEAMQFNLPGLLVGYRDYSGSFNNLGSNGRYWSSSEYNSSYSWYRNLYSGYSTVNRNYRSKAYGFSVRCIKD